MNVKGVTLQRNFEYTSLRHKIKNLLLEYIEFGGFPEIVDKERSLKTKILQEYFDLIFYKDLVDRYQIRSFATVKEMLLYLVNNFSSYFSTNKYYNTLKSQGKKIGKNTLFTYLACAKDINFVFMVPKYGKLKEQFANPKKVYVIDTGLINAISFKFPQNIGRLYENIVLIELKRRDNDVFYWKNKYECDFLTKKGEEVKEVIQVCYKLTDENKDREVNGLIEAMNKFKLNEGLIITGDFEGEEIEGDKKIIYKPLWKWLLE